MIGIPKQFNTRDDIENCINEPSIDRAALKVALMVLLGDAVIRIVSKTVAADYIAAEGETISEEHDMTTGEITRNVLVEADNLNSRLRLVLGMTPYELTTLLGDL